jgi:hypothetical protein
MWPHGGRTADLADEGLRFAAGPAAKKRALALIILTFFCSCPSQFVE